MERVEKPKTWEKTRAAQVYRHVRTGIYYVRGYVNGKDVWRSLGTDVFSVAQPKARDELAEIYRPRKAESALTSGIATFGDAAHVYEERLKANPKIKPSTLEYRRKTIEALYRWWPGLIGTKLKLVTDRACLDWAKKFRAHYHATRYNNTVDTLRHILEIEVERGVIYENPAASINKAKVTGRKLELPTKEEFAQLLNAIPRLSVPNSFTKPIGPAPLSLFASRTASSRWPLFDWAEEILDEDDLHLLDILKGAFRGFIEAGAHPHHYPLADVSFPGDPVFTDAVLQTLAGNKN